MQTGCICSLNSVYYRMFWHKCGTNVAQIWHKEKGSDVEVTPLVLYVFHYLISNNFSVAL